MAGYLLSLYQNIYHKNLLQYIRFYTTYCVSLFKFKIDNIKGLI